MSLRAAESSLSSDNRAIIMDLSPQQCDEETEEVHELRMCGQSKVLASG